MTPLIQRVMQIARSGRLGAINQVQAFNYVPYGGVYFGQWYRDFDVTGGLWLQKATHDFDYINHLVQSRTDRTSPQWAVVYLRRRDAARASLLRLRDRRHLPGKPRLDSCPRRRWRHGHRRSRVCAFSSSIRHHDAGSCPRSDTRTASTRPTRKTSSPADWPRGAAVRITVSYCVMLEFDWYDEIIRIVDHHATSVEEIKVTVPQGHHGGDSSLVHNFLDVIHRRDASHAMLHEGISARPCASPRNRAKTQQFIEIPQIRGDAAQMLASRRSRSMNAPQRISRAGSASTGRAGPSRRRPRWRSPGRRRSAGSRPRRAEGRSGRSSRWMSIVGTSANRGTR